MVGDLTWEDPPPPRHQHVDWGAIADRLIERPSHWAKVRENAPRHTAANVALRINRGGLVAFRPAGHFEARSRATGGGGSDLWVRYVGDRQEQP
jgi:hypothetical protein